VEEGCPCGRSISRAVQAARGGFLFLAALFVASPSAYAAGAGRDVQDISRRLCTEIGSQGRILWIDGTANLFRIATRDGVATWTSYTTDPANVADIVRRCKAAGANTLVVDVKPLGGEVLYDSRIAPHLRSWKGHAVPDTDILAAFLREGHRAGLQVDACVNVLSEGHKYFSTGPAYAHRSWQSVVYTIDRGLLTGDGARLSVHVPGDPSDPRRASVLGNDSTILGPDSSRGLIGLESGDSARGVVLSAPGMSLGRQTNLMLDSFNRVVGQVDSALLGDDPLIAPRSGRLLVASTPADREWVNRHVSPGSGVRFDARPVLVPVADAPSEKVACFVDPLNPEVRNYEISIVKEIVSSYDVDGIVLDRCRFSNINADFSDRERASFERWLGRRVSRWPEDVFQFSVAPGSRYTEGPLYREWLDFRARVIRGLVAEVARAVRSIRPSCKLGAYVGAWYPEYFGVGVNWGSENTDLRYSWFTRDYPETGYAEFMDWISTGCYFPTPTEEDARRQGIYRGDTVEFAAHMSAQAIANGCYVYGGVYVKDYAGDPERFTRAVEAAARQTNGWMVFDLSWIDAFNWWPALEKMSAESPAASPPAAVADLLSAIRSAADAARSAPD
jgi:uncharacterized lipoprotein YddW (UPF0748 family)